MSLDLNEILTAENKVEKDTGQESQSATDVNLDKQGSDGGELNRTTPEDTSKQDTNGTGPDSDDPNAATTESKTDDGNAGDGKAEGETAGTEGAIKDDAHKETTQTPPSDEQLSAYISEKTGGKVESVTALSELLARNEELVEETKKPREPEFKDERHKKAYEYLTNNQGEFTELSQEYHKILGIDTEKLGDREAQLQAFLLENKELPEDKARNFFEVQYKRKYGEMNELEDPEEKTMLEYEHLQATKKAKQVLAEKQNQIKESFKVDESAGKAKDAATETSEDMKVKIDEALNGQQIGVNLSFKNDKGEQVDQLKIDVPPEKMPDIKNKLADPDGLFQELLVNKSRDAQGNFSFPKYAENYYRLANFDTLMQKSYNQGLSKGQVMKLDEAKHSEADQGGRAPEPSKEETWGQTAVKALKNQN